MENDEILELLQRNKLLARAMDVPSLKREGANFAYDFSTWANEYEIAENEGLDSVSSTLLVNGEKVPTYKAIGFLLNSDNTEILHVSERDSCSCGDTKSGTFKAQTENLGTLDALAKCVSEKKENVMNEVNVNFKSDAFVGIFVNKAISQLPLAQALLAQKTFELQTGKSLPVYGYNNQEGSLKNLELTQEKIASFLTEMINSGTLKSTTITYETEKGQTQTYDYLAELQKQKVVGREGFEPSKT